MMNPGPTMPPIFPAEAVAIFEGLMHTLGGLATVVALSAGVILAVTIGRRMEFVDQLRTWLYVAWGAAMVVTALVLAATGHLKYLAITGAAVPIAVATALVWRRVSDRIASR